MEQAQVRKARKSALDARFIVLLPIHNHAVHGLTAC